MSNDVLEEARRLFNLGWAIIWLHPRDKRPVASGWTTGDRTPWEELRKCYVPGYNVGVRTGEASRIQGKYLACIDIDVKSEEHRAAAIARLKELTGVLQFPEVRSGGGNGSRHLYCLTDRPFKMVTVAKVKKQWEICIYSSGRQMALPPSIHPSGRLYQWKRGFEGVESLPVLPESVWGASRASAQGNAEERVPPQKSNREEGDSAEKFVFTPTSVQLDWLDIPESIKKLIKDGVWKGASFVDRSDYLPVAATGLLSAGCTRDDILTLLTERDYYLGRAALDRRGGRRSAAEWVWTHTLKKVMAERDAKTVFQDAPSPEIELSAEEAAKQEKEIEEARHWTEGLKRTQGQNGERGKIKNTLNNIYLILKNSFGEPLFRFNEFAKRDEIWQKTPWSEDSGVEFQERDIQKIKLWLSKNFEFEASDQNVWAALINIADKNSYHPIREYLMGLPAHDGVPRLDFFLERYLKGHAPKKYMRVVSRKMIVAMVARVFVPGVKFDTMLVLEGEQGLRKSTAVATLASIPWFSDVNLNLKNKDSISDMAGKWVIEQGEMNVMTHHEVGELKQFLSRGTDRMRPSYGRKSQDYPRQSVFIGTTNDNIYLKDPSGSRRFWPIKVTSECDIEAIERDRDQIFAEALMRYREGEKIWISDAETNHLAKLQQEERETSDELVYVIEKWIEEKSLNADFNGRWDPECIQLASLWEMGGPLQNSNSGSKVMERSLQTRAAACLRALGYERGQRRIMDQNRKMWVLATQKESLQPVWDAKNDE